MKLIHTADTHLDTLFAEPGMPADYGARRRRQLRECFAKLVTHALNTRADALLVAGDLYDAGRVTRDTVNFLREQFERAAPLPVLIAPGNRDPFTADSPYAVESWPSNVVIFGDPEWRVWEARDIPLTVHGIGFADRDPSASDFMRLRVPRDGRIHAALAHGTAEGHLSPPHAEPRGMFSLAEIIQPGLNYVALGHAHIMRALAREPGMQAWYCGPPEGHGFDECGHTGFLEVVVEPAADGGPPAVSISPMTTAGVFFSMETVDASAAGDAAAAAAEACERMLAAAGGVPVAGRVRLTGAAPGETRAAIHAALEGLRPRFAWLAVLDETALDANYGEFAREDTALGEFTRRTGDALADAADAERAALCGRAREIGVAALLGAPLDLPGLDGEAL